MTSRLPDSAYDYEHFTHARLDRILPVAQARRIADMDFTLLALECYAQGFAATVLMEQDWRMPSPPPPADEVELPQLLKGVPLVTEVVDDGGNHYTGHLRSGAGGGGGDSGLLNHMVYCFAPALRPAARCLTLTLTQVDRPDYDDGRPTWSEDKVVGGPWVLSFPLETPAENGTAPVTVIPVAQHIRNGAIAATVTTVERHAWGFVVNSRLDWAGADGPFPRPVWRATDDRGGDYGRSNCGGGGNMAGASDVNSLRMYCEFRREIDPAASELRLELASFSARQAIRDEAEDRFDHWETRREASSLGAIVVPLPAQIR